MKNEDDEPKEYFERNLFIVFALLILGLFLDWLCVYMLINTNPWGTMVAIPGLMFTLQGLWLLVNPFAIVYEDRFEIKQSLIYNKQFYFLDAKNVELTSSSKLSLIYNDDEPEALKTMGIKDAHRELFINKLKEKIAKSVSTRLF